MNLSGSLREAVIIVLAVSFLSLGIRDGFGSSRLYTACYSWCIL